MITPSPLSIERESHTAVCRYITTVYDNTVAAEYREREREGERERVSI